MKKPNFFIVGAPRSGTTALYHYLKQHPDIFMSDYTEPHYFCTDFHRESDKFFNKKIRFPIRTNQNYLRLFKNASNEKLIGEATPEYLYSKDAAKNIYHFNPYAKIIISLRNPVDFLFSLHAQLLVYSGEDIPDFEKALDIETERRKGRYIPKGLLWPSSLYYSDRIKYSEQVQRFYDNFSKDQIKIIIFEDFKKDNLGVYKDILKFLGVDDNFKPVLNIYNPRSIPRLLFINQLLVKLGNVSIKNILPATLRKGINKTIRKLNKKPEKKESLDNEFRNKLYRKYMQEIEALSNIIDRDLVKLWCEEKQ